MLVLAMTVSMTACGNKNNAADDANAVEDTPLFIFFCHHVIFFLFLLLYTSFPEINYP